MSKLAISKKICYTNHMTPVCCGPVLKTGAECFFAYPAERGPFHFALARWVFGLWYFNAVPFKTAPANSIRTPKPRSCNYP